MSDIDTGVVDSLKALDPDGRLEKKQTSLLRAGTFASCQKGTYAVPQTTHEFALLTSSARSTERAKM